MPNLQHYRETYYSFTEKVSTNVRNLSISAIGIVWIFKIQDHYGGYDIPAALYLPVILVLSAMALDFAQYLYASVAWGIFFRRKEKQGVTEDQELDASIYLNLPSSVFFYGKVLLIAPAYFFLVKFLMVSVHWG